MMADELVKLFQQDKMQNQYALFLIKLFDFQYESSDNLENEQILAEPIQNYKYDQQSISTQMQVGQDPIKKFVGA